jgi:hypothetical protein
MVPHGQSGATRQLLAHSLRSASVRFRGTTAFPSMRGRRRDSARVAGRVGGRMQRRIGGSGPGRRNARVDGALSLSRDRHARGPLALISPGLRHCYHSTVVCCDGTWVAPSDVHVQTAGAWKEGEMARDPGGPCQSVAAKRQQMVAEPLPALAAQGRSEVPARDRAESQKLARDRKRRRRGRRKATRCGGRKPSIGCGVGIRVTRRTLRNLPRGA